jgi:hypothetical protein
MRYLVLFLMTVSLCMFSLGCTGEKKTGGKKTNEKPAAGEKEKTE